MNIEATMGCYKRYSGSEGIWNISEDRSLLEGRKGGGFTFTMNGPITALLDAEWANQRHVLKLEQVGLCVSRWLPSPLF